MMKLINKLLIENLKDVPFHNFRLILEREMPLELGGTCSDKTLFFQKKLKEKNIESILHSARIKGKEIHRLLKVKINNQDFFLDIGLGWPIIYPIPVDRNISYKFYGLEFKTEIHNDLLVLCRKKGDEFVENYRTIITDMDQPIILNQIENRFNNIDKYPFNNKLRFSKIVGDDFYFIRDDILEYSEGNKLFTRKLQSLDEFELLFKNVFDFDLDIVKEVAKKLKMFDKKL